MKAVHSRDRSRLQKVGAEVAPCQSYQKGLFGRLIYDEAQKIKSSRTKSYNALAELTFTSRILITASVTLNKPKDLINSLSLIFKP